MALTRGREGLESKEKRQVYYPIILGKKLTPQQQALSDFAEANPRTFFFSISYNSQLVLTSLPYNWPSRKKYTFGASDTPECDDGVYFIWCDDSNRVIGLYGFF